MPIRQGSLLLDASRCVQDSIGHPMNSPVTEKAATFCGRELFVRVGEAMCNHDSLDACSARVDSPRHRN
jgi:hypothetical protein